MIGVAWSRQIDAGPVIGVLRFEGTIDFDTADYLIDVMDAARRDENVAGGLGDVATDWCHEPVLKLDAEATFRDP